MITQAQTLPPNYTSSRPVRLMTANLRNELTAIELLWIHQQWRDFRGGPEDMPFNVIYELISPITQTRLWIVDRDGEEHPDHVIAMLPSDY